MTLDLLNTVERLPAVPLFVELFAGTAALSLRLQQAKTRPPISRMGAKTGYADAILAALGLAPGMKAACYLWCEPDDGARALLMSYALPSLRREAADIILSWKDEDPRALWERLRAEGPIKGVDGREVARWAYISQACYRRGQPESGYDDEVSRGRRHAADVLVDAWLPESFGLPPTTTTPDARAIDPREVARVMRLLTANRLINLDPQTWSNTGQGGTTHGGAEFCTPPERLAAAALGVPDEWPEVVICADGAMVDAREVARWVLLGGWSYRQGQPDSGVAHPGMCHQTERDGLAQRLSSLPTPWPPTTITADARSIMPPTLPEGTVVYMDPPYQGTTGYAHGISRDEVLGLACWWEEAGAQVVLSEAVALGSIVHDSIGYAEPGPLEGWHSYEITAKRKGQKRTFSKQKREWITMSRPADPAWVEDLGLVNLQARRAFRAPSI